MCLLNLEFHLLDSDGLSSINIKLNQWLIEL